MKYWNTLGPVTLVHQRLFDTLQNSPCMMRCPLSIVCLFTFQISKPSISMMKMIWRRLWTVMPPKRLSLLSGLLQIAQSLQQSSIPISTSPITLFGRKSPENRSHGVKPMSLGGCTLFTHLQESADMPRARLRSLYARER